MTVPHRKVAISCLRCVDNILKPGGESGFIAVRGGEEGLLFILHVGCGGRGIGMRLAEVSDVGEFFGGELFFSLLDEPMDSFMADVEDGGGAL